MNPARRMATSSIGNLIGPGSNTFGPFSPSADDDPYHAGPTPDWQIGFVCGQSVTGSVAMTSWDMTFNSGYQVIFKVYDQGASRSVHADVTGAGLRREAEQLVKHVFAQM